MTTKPSHIFAIDIGNTRIKWALFKASESSFLENLAQSNLTVFDRHILLHSMIVSQGNCLHDELATHAFPAQILDASTQVIISNVASETLFNAVSDKLNPQINVQLLSSEDYSCGIQNHYDHPAQLGTDRWAALIAAWNLHQADCVVVNAGTAVTIDVILKDISDDSHNSLNAFSQTHTTPKAHFIGGLICPGLHLMQQSLHQNTATLFAKSLESTNTQTHDFIAKNTKSAITLGARTAVCSCISHTIQQVALQTNSAPTLIISGGDAFIVANQLMHPTNSQFGVTPTSNSGLNSFGFNSIELMTNAPIIIDNLVLYGLYLQQSATH